MPVRTRKGENTLRINELPERERRPAVQPYLARYGTSLCRLDIERNGCRLVLLRHLEDVEEAIRQRRCLRRLRVHTLDFKRFKVVAAEPEACLAGLIGFGSKMDPQCHRRLHATVAFIAPISGVRPGIYGDVELRLVPEVSLSDVFIKTFVTAKRIEVDITVSNAGTTPRTVQPQVSIVDAKGIAQTSLQGEPITVQPGKEQTVTLQKEWVAPHLWSPETPMLYNAQVNVRDTDALLDS